jgi:hypothetical protein
MGKEFQKRLVCHGRFAARMAAEFSLRRQMSSRHIQWVPSNGGFLRVAARVNSGRFSGRLTRDEYFVLRMFNRDADHLLE